jgi:hypothetical protein
MRRRLCTAAFALACAATAFPDAPLIVTGRVVEAARGAPVAAAMVAIVETDAVTDADTEGRFSLPVPGPGAYTIAAGADGFEESKTAFTAPVEGALTIQLQRVSFSMDIQVSEPRQKTTPTRTITKEEIQKTPTGGDPFEAVNREPGVVKVESGILDKGFGMLRMALASALGFDQFAFIQPFSYRSLPDYSNAFFLEGYIPLPFLTYPSISNAFSMSIFPEAVVQSLELYGGGVEPSVGPGAGLVTNADVTPPRPDAVRWGWQASLLGAEAQALFPVLGRSTLSLSLRKSYYEYTWLPLLFLADRAFGWRVFYDPFGENLKTEVSPGSGDLLIHYDGPIGDAHRISADVAACLSYTHFLLDRVLPSGDGGDHTVMNTDSLYLVTAAGVSWAWTIAPGLRNTLRAFDSLYTTRTDSGMGYFSGEYYDESSSYPYNLAGASDTVWFSPAPRLECDLGAEARHVYGAFEHRVDVSDHTFIDWEARDLRGQALSALEGSLWCDATWDLKPWVLRPSLRLDWFSKALGSADDPTGLRASPLLTATWFPDDANEIVISVGQRGDRFDYFDWILFTAAQGKELQGFWVSSQKSVIDQKYLMESPARLSAAQATWRIQRPGLKLGVLAYGYWMDQMSGFNFQSFKTSEQSLAYTDASVSVEGTEAENQDVGYQDADRMYSTGTSISGTFTWGGVELTCLYTLGYSRIHLGGTDAWMAPNSDITNYLKLYLHLPLGKRWSWDLNANAACGIPATPSMLTYYEESSAIADGGPLETWVAVQDRYNQMRDWMPRVTVNFKTEFAFNSSYTLFLDVANLLSLVHYEGPDPAKVAVGGIETSWLDRRYTLLNVDMDYLLNVKVDFGLRYRPS